MDDYYEKDIILMTDRLILRPLKTEDRPDIHRNIYHDKEVQRYYLAPYIEKEEDVDLAGMINRCRERRIYVFAIVLKETSDVIGMINQCDSADENDRSVELAYATGSSYWNQGYMTEALRAGCQFMFREYKMHRVEAFILPENERSIALVNRLGFTYEGKRISYMHINGAYRDHEAFYLLSDAL